MAALCPHATELSSTKVQTQAFLEPKSPGTGGELRPLSCNLPALSKVSCSATSRHCKQHGDSLGPIFSARTAMQASLICTGPWQEICSLHHVAACIVPKALKVAKYPRTSSHPIPSIHPFMHPFIHPSFHPSIHSTMPIYTVMPPATPISNPYIHSLVE